jgi:hypothetical protein
MITLICTKCGKSLEVDDGFAGGVCRCIHCGTIQTVPTKRAGKLVSGKAIYAKKDRSESQALNELSEIVSSSGLGGSGLSNRPSSRKPVAKKSMGPLWAGIGAGLLLAAGIGVGLFLKSGPPASTETSSSPNSPGNPSVSTPSNEPVARSPGNTTPAITSPHFGPVVLRGKGTVIYFIDRGDATVGDLPALRRLVIESIRSLPAGARFQVRYWTSGEDSPAFPAAPEPATARNIEQATLGMESMGRAARTQLQPALKLALAHSPAEVVIVTGKAASLDDSFAAEVKTLLQGRSIVVHAIALNTDASSASALETISKGTGGVFTTIDSAALSGK